MDQCHRRESRAAAYFIYNTGCNALEIIFLLVSAVLIFGRRVRKTEGGILRGNEPLPENSCRAFRIRFGKLTVIGKNVKNIGKR